MKSTYSLPELGWKSFFQQQLTLDDLVIARVVAQQRSLIHLYTGEGELSLSILPNMPAMTVGDWLLVDKDSHFVRLLNRQSLFSRKAAGTRVHTQLIAANIDSVFIVTSLNQDFNLNRIERYLALAHEADVEPVIVLTKADLCDNTEHYSQQVQSLDPLLQIVAVNSLDSISAKQLDHWCTTGNTVALLGSSGVGKSTLVNTLLGDTVMRTSAIREDDDKGRHTTTGRSLHLLPAGGLLMDTPGMREIQLADCEHGVEDTFKEITELESQCKFSDCQHQNEPGCAVREAIDSGSLDERRLNSYQKLLREQAFNKATLAERRAKDKDFGKMVKSVMESKRKR